MWAAPFIPDFKDKVRPLETLLSPKGEGVWTQECTDALNQMLRTVERRLTLAIADPYAPMHVYVSTSPTTGMVMITQVLDLGETRVVALVSRSLTAYEAGRPPLEQKLHIVRWALHRCRRFTATSPTVTVHIPDPA